MKQLKFFTTFGLAAVILFFTSCHSGNDKEADKPTKEETITAPSGPTDVMIVKHKVADYAKWKPGYDAHDSARLANGLHSYVIARGLDADSNMVMVAMTMDDVNKAKAMGADPSLKDVMKKAGVTGPPEIDYLHSVMNDTTAIQQTIRLMVRSKVKDFDAFKKSFDTHNQVRKDAGLTDRVIAYSVDDNHNITLVFAIADLDKAKAFLESKELKERMDEAGVVGAPSFYFYKIVAKY